MALIDRHEPAIRRAAQRLGRDGRGYVLASDGYGGKRRDAFAWRSPHERRVRAAIVAARRGVG